MQIAVKLETTEAMFQSVNQSGFFKLA